MTRWVTGALAVISFLDLVALGIAARHGDGAAQNVLVVLVVAGMVWWCLAKLTSSQPVDEGWYDHLRFLTYGSLLLVLGLAGAVLGGFAGAWSRPLGVLGVAVGGLMLVAGQRDFVRWRSAVDEERHRTAGETGPAAGRSAW